MIMAIDANVLASMCLGVPHSMLTSAMRKAVPSSNVKHE